MFAEPLNKGVTASRHEFHTVLLMHELRSMRLQVQKFAAGANPGSARVQPMMRLVGFLFLAQVHALKLWA